MTNQNKLLKDIVYVNCLLQTVESVLVATWLPLYNDQLYNTPKTFMHYINTPAYQGQQFYSCLHAEGHSY